MQTPEIVICQLNTLFGLETDYQERFKNLSEFYLKPMTHIPVSGKPNTTHPDIVMFESVDRCLKHAEDLNAEWVFIAAHGFRCIDHNFIYMCINYAKGENFSTLAHILQKDGFYELHQQCLLISVTDWIACDRPLFGRFDKLQVNLPKVERSTENFHDDYTPTQIWHNNGLGTGGRFEHDGYVYPGWNLLSTFLEKGYKVGNFTPHLRSLKQHLYPEVGDELRKYFNGEFIDVLSEPNQQEQRKRLEDIHDNAVYVYNTDPMGTHFDRYSYKTKLDTVYSVAAGFKAIEYLESATWTEDTRVVYFDYTRRALDFKQWLWENWDGKNYNEAIKEYSANKDFNPVWFAGRNYKEHWEEFVQHWGGMDEWLEIWNCYKALDHKFLYINLFEDRRALLEDMVDRKLDNPDSNNIIWFSNSYYTEYALWHFKPQVLRNMYKDFMEELRLSNNNIEIIGSPSPGQAAITYHGKHRKPEQWYEANAQ